jgi:hypothetical protein
VSGQLHTPAVLPPDTHWIWGRVDFRAGLEDMEKCGEQRILGPSVVQPAASHYTNCAIPAHRLSVGLLYKGLADWSDMQSDSSHVC